MAAALGVAPAHLVTCYQIHSPDVIVAETPWTRETAPRADAIVTRVPGLAVGVGTADCGPILFADAEAGVIGAAHAGWKGALTGVLEATIAAMEKLGAERSAHQRRARADDPPAELRGRAGIRRALRRRQTPRTSASSRRRHATGHAMFDLPGYISVAARTRRNRKHRRPRPLHLCGPGALLQLPPHHPSRPSRITAVTSTRLRS